MTDEMRAREKAICEVANVSDIGEVSDGFHTFNGLYEQRMILFAALVKAYKDKAWKSYRHEDGEYCFGGGWFIVGIDTPEGSYTYHYENKYWDMFDCVDLPRAKHWDGHTEEDAETRLMSLKPAQPEQLGTNLAEVGTDCISRQAAIDALKNDMASLDHIIKGMSAYDVRLDAYVSQRNQVNYDIYTINNLPPAQLEPYTDALKAEIKRMKRSFTICINSDYYTGYMSALSAVEGYIAHMEVTT